MSKGPIHLQSLQDAKPPPPWLQGLKLSAYALCVIFLPSAILIGLRTYHNLGFVTLSGMIWVVPGALIILPALCFAYAYIAHNKGEHFARTWFVGPLLLGVLATIAGFAYYQVYVVGFE